MSTIHRHESPHPDLSETVRDFILKGGKGTLKDLLNGSEVSEDLVKALRWSAKAAIRAPGYSTNQDASVRLGEMMRLVDKIEAHVKKTKRSGKAQVFEY